MSARPLGPVLDDATLSWLLHQIGQAFVTLNDVCVELQTLRDPGYEPNVGYAGGASELSPREKALRAASDATTRRGGKRGAATIASDARRRLEGLARKAQRDIKNEQRRHAAWQKKYDAGKFKVAVAKAHPAPSKKGRHPRRKAAGGAA